MSLKRDLSFLSDIQFLPIGQMLYDVMYRAAVNILHDYDNGNPEVIEWVEARGGERCIEKLKKVRDEYGSLIHHVARRN